MSTSAGQPFLRWAGSKRQLLPVLARFWRDDYDRYVEPFAGSACLFFRLRPGKALLGDINSELITTYQQVQGGVDAVIAALGELTKGPEHYAKLRATDPCTLSAADRAARFIYLNRFCFNGLYRTNRSGRFNVPYGGEKAGNLPSEEHMRTCSRLLRSAALVAADFEVVLDQVRPGDFVYMDPPFSTKSRRVFNEYDPSTFGTQDVHRLRKRMEALATRDIAFLVSYDACYEAEALCDGFNTERVTVKRNIAGFAGSRGDCQELLIWNTTSRAQEEPR